MNSKFLPAAVFAVLFTLAMAPAAQAAITVDITAVSPADGQLDDDSVNELIVDWEIEVDDGESGKYRVEVGGDGTPESGRLIDDDDGKGDFNGNLTGTSTVRVSEDFKEGDGDYVVYVYAVDDEDAENYGSDSVTVNLDNPPDRVEGIGVGTGDGKLFLSWSLIEDRDIKDYLVYYSTVPGSDAGDYDGTDADEGDSPIEVNGEDSEITLSGLFNDVTYYIRIAAKDDNGAIGDLSEEKSGTPAIVSGFVDAYPDEEGCFVATAAFGDLDAPEVRVLRNLRDEVLLHHNAGRAFVRWYYRNSPPMAALIAKHPALRSASRAALAPLVWSSTALLATPPRYRGWAVAAGIVLTVLPLGIVFTAVRRRKRNACRGLPLAALTAAVALSLLLVPAPAQALDEGSPINFSANAHFGFLFPQEDTFEKVYDAQWMSSFGFEFGWKMVRDLELVGNVSYGLIDGKGITVGGGSTAEDYQFHLAPVTLSILYRLKFVADQWVVPFVGAGFAGAYYHELRVDDPDIKTDGGRYGYMGQAGLQILLDLLDKRASGAMDRDFGVNNTYIFYEFRYLALNDFHQIDPDEKLDLTSMVHTVGLLFEF